MIAYQERKLYVLAEMTKAFRILITWSKQCSSTKRKSKMQLKEWEKAVPLWRGVHNWHWVEMFNKGKFFWLCKYFLWFIIVFSLWAPCEHLFDLVRTQGNMRMNSINYMKMFGSNNWFQHIVQWQKWKEEKRILPPTLKSFYIGR